MSRDSFFATKEFQTDYMTVHTGGIQIELMDIDELIDDNILKVKKIMGNNVSFTSYRDRRLPFNSGLIKPLPTSMIKKIPLSIAVDTLQLTNSYTLYTEGYEKIKPPAIIPITRMNVLLKNVKNYDLKKSDSVTIKASGYVLDTVWTRLQVKQSYADSLQGFQLRLSMKPDNLQPVNDVLVPLGNVRFISGVFDTIELKALGREYLAIGEMKMFYEKLKIEILKKGTGVKKGFWTRLRNLIANSFVIKTNNKSKTGDVFFIRQRDKSAINYLVKIAISGMSSSTGAKSYKKMIKKHRKELAQKELPPAEL
jgi:hypothetical protein